MECESLVGEYPNKGDIKRLLALLSTTWGKQEAIVTGHGQAHSCAEAETQIYWIVQEL